MKTKRFGVISLVVSLWSGVNAQSLPGGLPVQFPKSALSTRLLVLPAKPEIPYLEELRQIQSLKKSYDSLRSELRDLKEVAGDSTRQDSVLNITKSRSRQVLEQESKVLGSLIESGDIPGEEIKNAAKNTLDRVNDSKVPLKEINDISGLESLIDQNDENLKALTNEWIMPRVEEQLNGTGKEGFDFRSGELPDFYGKDALAELTKKGLPSEVPFEQAKQLAQEKTGHISEEHIQKAGKDFSKLKIDSLGNVKIVPSQLNKKKTELYEKNQLKGDPLFHRIGMNLWYDPLTSFGEGFLLDYGLSYSFSQQFAFLGGVSWKKLFDKDEKLRREGVGMFTGLRFGKGNWFVQGTVNRNQVTNTHPSGYESRDFEGKTWASNLAIGRTIPMGKTIRSVVIGSIDPFFDHKSSLYKSRIQLKIGLEIGSFKQIKKSIKEQIPMDELKQRGEDKVEYFIDSGDH